MDTYLAPFRQYLLFCATRPVVTVLPGLYCSASFFGSYSDSLLCISRAFVLCQVILLYYNPEICFHLHWFVFSKFVLSIKSLKKNLLCKRLCFPLRFSKKYLLLGFPYCGQAAVLVSMIPWFCLPHLQSLYARVIGPTAFELLPMREGSWSIPIG